MSDFHVFATRVHEHYLELSKNELYVAGTAGDDVFTRYLASFPRGSNPIYKTRTEYDCSCCKSFVRNIGRVVSLKDGKVDTVWNVPGLEFPYKEVAEAMHRFLVDLPITSVFRTKEKQYGNAVTRQLLEDGTVKRWNHFHGQIGRHLANSPGTEKGLVEGTKQVLERGLKELKPDAFVQVLELIDSNALYRGAEHRKAVQDFYDLQQRYLNLESDKERQIFVWLYSNNMATRFRNTVIGTLVQDISEGVDLEQAVLSFETKVAPTNYKRTTALITPRMVDDAMKTIKELDIEQTLYRRLAKLSDISVNNVLWVDRADQPLMKGSLKDILMTAAKGSGEKGSDKAVPIHVEAFMKEVLPRAQGIELYVTNQHLSNFMTLTAPQYPDTGKLFKWNNDFAWSYSGNVTDSIKERVKKAGGNVNAVLRFSLAWHNFDDLDLHVIDPYNRHIYFGDKGSNRDGSRNLDVDMNAGYGRSREPVENVSFTWPRDGLYTVFVHQYMRRETDNLGFTVEIADRDTVQEVTYPGPVAGEILVGKFRVDGGHIVQAEYGNGLKRQGIPQHKWGITTQNNVRVRTIMHSPNYWDNNEVGNKHWFFILEGCRTKETTRGIYNEFLSSGLEKHRKVFETLGNKTQCPPTDEQLSGLGFSSTIPNKVVVTVHADSGTRSYEINF